MDYDRFSREISDPLPSIRSFFYRRTTSFSARIVTDVFTIHFIDGSPSNFVGAVISGNDRMFLLEVCSSIDVTWEVYDTARITAIGARFISILGTHNNHVVDSNRVIRVHNSSNTNALQVLGIEVPTRRLPAPAAFLRMIVINIEVQE